ncbi:efflux RND transporter periplasmic adaptor subunit [Rhodoligotrophos ferricapiens]|uniref:efflux RND transporter periplasmic adaptor subunit n=1 Tax=Rhodoligotrophos ferricapiens TaxID=3069264 RepID=UPI00315DD52D
MITAASPVLIGCDDQAASKDTPGAAAEAPPQPVSVVTVRPERLPIVNELPGRIAPLRVAEVRPRVSGIVIERVFEQGSEVKEGDVLYRIDPEPFRVRVASAEAALKRAEAGRLQAQQTAERIEQLRKQRVVSTQQQDDAVAALAQAQADVASAKAQLDAARLDLQYADVRAPISGRIGRALITEGALVSASGAEPLATIRQLDPVYADFNQSVNDLLALRRSTASGSLSEPNEGEATVKLIFDDGTPYKYSGKVLFSEATVDETTGQVLLRGEFPNPDGELLPGMYVRVQVEQGVEPNAIAVPQQAVQRDTSGHAQVYVVGEDSIPQLRTVKAGRTLGDRWVINAGLKPGERVVVEGFQKIRPGMKVQAQAWAPAGEGASAPGKQADASTSPVQAN